MEGCVIIDEFVFPIELTSISCLKRWVELRKIWLNTNKSMPILRPLKVKMSKIVAYIDKLLMIFFSFLSICFSFS